MRIAAASVVALLALSAASCSIPGSGDGGTPPSSAPPASAPASASAAAPSSGAGSSSSSPSTAGPAPSSGSVTPADPNQPSSGDQLGEVVATRKSSAQEDEVALTLYPLLRDGATSHLNLALSSSARKPASFQVGTMLSDHNDEASDKDGFAADGLQLVDGKNAKLYLVASDGKGQCLCSRGLAGVFLRDDLPVLISATFAAPPADVTQVDVRIPGFGTVKNVPVQ